MIDHISLHDLSEHARSGTRLAVIGPAAVTFEHERQRCRDERDSDGSVESEGEGFDRPSRDEQKATYSLICSSACLDRQNVETTRLHHHCRCQERARHDTGSEPASHAGFSKEHPTTSAKAPQFPNPALRLCNRTSKATTGDFSIKEHLLSALRSKRVHAGAVQGLLETQLTFQQRIYGVHNSLATRPFSLPRPTQEPTAH